MLITSENQLTRKLNGTWAIESARGCHRTEIARCDRIVRIESLLNLRIRIAGARMVKEIPSLRTKLELQVLPDREALEERKVDIAESWTVDGISP